MTKKQMLDLIEQQNRIIKQIPDLSHVPAVTLQELVTEYNIRQNQKAKQREATRKLRRKKNVLKK